MSSVTFSLFSLSFFAAREKNAAVNIIIPDTASSTAPLALCMKSVFCMTVSVSAPDSVYFSAVLRIAAMFARSSAAAIVRDTKRSTHAEIIRFLFFGLLFRRRTRSMTEKTNSHSRTMRRSEIMNA